ncbi:MAG: Xaa-Pro peptidase family protein [Phycisphaerales bacterium]|nr:Xaa-Pro peptidase family protein [Phycisphaerales bacterium]
MTSPAAAQTKSPNRPTSAKNGKAESGPPHAHRLQRLARIVADMDIATFLVTNPKDVGYLTGFLGGDSYLIVQAASHKAPKPVVVSDFRYKEELEHIQSIADVHIRTGPMMDALGQLLVSGGGQGESAGKIGIQAEHMTIAERASIARKLGAGGGKRLSDTMGVVPRLRVIKDDLEIGLIKKAAKIQQDALMAVLPTIKPGQTESEVAAAIESEMKRRGSSEPGFQTIVAAGANGSLPHYRPQQKKLAAGKPLLIDWGAVYQGYHSDMTRTFSLGKWPAKVAEIFQIALDAQMKSAAALAPGKSTKEIDGIARDHIAKAGYADFFGHGLGHGLGLNGHEEPRLTNMLAPTRLEPGMVVTIEPGIYLPGVGGVRIEDDYVITDTGAECLCSMKKDLEWCTL